MPPMTSAIGTRLSLAQVISSDPVTVRPNGSAVEMDVYANFAGSLTVGQQVLTGFDESGRLVVFAQTTNPDYIPNTAGAVQSINIAEAAVTRENILAGAIDRTRIAQGEVTAALIAIDAIDETHISPEAITTPAIAANAIVGYHIVANSISASHISAYTITAQEIAAQSIVASRILAGTITADRIATNTLTAAQIATGAITSDEIATGTIQAGDIQTGTLTSASGVFGAISANDITTGTLTADRIGAGTLSVGTIILNGAVLSSGNYNGNFDGGTGWSMNGTNAVFNNVTIRGVLSGVTGTFSGALSGGTILIGSGANAFRADSNGIYLGSATFASAPFRVTPAGVVTASNISITGGTININSGQFQVDGTGNIIVGGARSLRWDGTNDVTISADTASGLLVLSPVGSTYSLRPMLIENTITANAVTITTGSLAVGTVSPQAVSHFLYNDRPSNPVVVVANRAPVGGGNDAHGIDIYLGQAGSPLINTDSGDRYIRFRRPDGTILGRIEGNGGGVAYQVTSDQAHKSDISDDIAEGAAAFDKIPWRSYTWKTTGHRAHGVVAQQVAEVPEWAPVVSQGKTFEEADPDTGEMRQASEPWAVDYVPFIGAMGAKIKQLEDRIRQLEAV